MLGLYVPPSVDPAIAAALEKFAEEMVCIVAMAYADHRTPAPTKEEPYPWPADPTTEEWAQARADTADALQEFLRG